MDMKDKPAKKVAILLPFFGDGGMERAVINLASGMKLSDVAIDLVLLKRGYGTLDLEIPENVHKIELDSRNLIHALFCFRRYVRLAQPLSVLSLSTPANLVSIFSRITWGGSYRTIVSTQVAIKTDASTSKWKAKLRPFIYRTYNFADVVHAVSKGVADDLLSFGVRREKIKVIYNPIISPDLEKKGNEPVPHLWFQEKRTWPIIIGVGRLVPQKDFLLLLRAFSIVRKKRDARLLILGEGEQRPLLENLARDLGIVSDFSLPGFSNNPYAYMKQSDLFVLSSAWEGFGNVLAEAMALGTPVVSTNCFHGPAEILENGRYGELVPVGDPIILADAILRALDAPRSSAELKAAAGRFLISKVAESYISMMNIK